MRRTLRTNVHWSQDHFAWGRWKHSNKKYAVLDIDMYWNCICEVFCAGLFLNKIWRRSFHDNCVFQSVWLTLKKAIIKCSGIKSVNLRKETKNQATAQKYWTLRSLHTHRFPELSPWVRGSSIQPKAPMAYKKYLPRPSMSTTVGNYKGLFALVTGSKIHIIPLIFIVSLISPFILSSQNQ